MTDLMAVTIDTRQGPITIATDYIPPSIQTLNTVDYNRLFMRQNPVYLLADLNAKHTSFDHNSCNSIGDALNDLYIQNKFHHIGPYFTTYHQTNCATTPDIVLGNHRTFHNIHLTPGPVTSSDHIPIIAKITANPIQIPIRPRKQFAKTDWDKFSDELKHKNITIPTNSSTSEIDSAITDWTNLVTEVADKHTPTLEFRVLPGPKPNNVIRTLQLQHDYTYNYMLIYGLTTYHSRRLVSIRQKLRLEYQHLATEAWNEIVRNIEIASHSGDTQFWRSIKRFRGCYAHQTSNFKDSNGTTITDDETKVRLFQTHWSKIFTTDLSDEAFDRQNIISTELNVRSKRSSLDPYSHSDITRLDPSFPSVSPEEIKDLVDKLKLKACGPSGLTKRHLTNLPLNMIQILTNIFNHCLSIGYFPDSWKVAMMIFIHKSGTLCLLDNYRGISLLDIEGKILDKILNQREKMHSNINDLHNDRQHGFRSNRGTHTALGIFYESIACHYKKGHTIDIVQRDVSKAFDKVWHDGLRHKILQLNIHPCFTKILNSFITNRTAKIRIGQHSGDAFPLNSGVPQGACLSPSLYNLYTRDIPPPIPCTDYVQYADDLTQIISLDISRVNRNKHRRIAERTARAIDSISDYESKWLIKTNTSKFTITPISRRKTHQVKLKNNTKIDYKRKVTVLGLHMTSCNIAQHANHRAGLAKNKLAKLYRFRHLSQRNKTKLVKSIIIPTLTYPAVPGNVFSNARMLLLQRVQNKALRFITNTSFSDRVRAEALHNRLNFEPINLRIHRLAQRTWEKIKDFHPETYNSLSSVDPPPPVDQRKWFPSSRRLAENPPTTPIYV